MALRRALRLRKNSEFQRVRQQGRSISSRLLILAWLPNDPDPEDEVFRLRIGFVVSKRISKSAVRRNYIKRLLSEAIRPFLPELSKLSGHWDVVITARHSAVDATLPLLIQEIGTLLRRARLLTATSAPAPAAPEQAPEASSQDETHKGYLP